MVFVVHGELVTRMVAIEWLISLGALKYATNVCMGYNKARFITMSHSWKSQ